MRLTIERARARWSREIRANADSHYRALDLLHRPTRIAWIRQLIKNDNLTDLAAPFIAANCTTALKTYFVNAVSVLSQSRVCFLIGFF